MKNKKDKDTDQAICVLSIWLIAFSGGLIIADKYNFAAGLFLSISVTLFVVLITYYDWRNERTKERLNNYIEDNNKRIKEVMRRGR